MKPIQGIAASGCTSVLGYHQMCTLTLTVNGSSLKGDVFGGPILCEHSNSTQCYQPSQANSLAIRLTQRPPTLTPSVSGLGLSVDCPTTSMSSDCAQKNDTLTGNPRKITITNTGSVNATNVVVNSTGLPSDASVSPSSCGTIAAQGGTCVITVTPGAIASANASNVLCTAGVEPEGSVNVTADGGLSASVKTYVLSYGCIYQGGFIYSVDDTTDNRGSIGGKALALTDQKLPPSGIVWDADPACTPPHRQCTQQTGAWDLYYGENLATIPGSANPNNTGTSGPGDTYQIVSTLNGQNGNTNNPANYAAAVCTTYTDGGYTDWYLPTICEMGPDSGGDSGCALGTPNIVDNLSFLIGDPNTSPDTSCSYGTNCLAGFHWSSTEFSDDPQNYAWNEEFNSHGSGQGIGPKYTPLGLRCSRALTL